MEKLTADDLQADDPQTFASNTLEIVDPARTTRPGSRRSPTWPRTASTSWSARRRCRAARRPSRPRRPPASTLTPVSEEQSVTDVLAKVTSGEADAGLVYVTDVTAAGDAVHGVPFPESSDIVNTYPIVALEDSDARRPGRRSSSTSCSATPGRPSWRRPASPSHDPADGHRQRPVGLPRWVYVPALVGAAFVLLPLVAIVARVDWAELRLADHLGGLARGVLAEPARRRPPAPLLCVVFGVPMALVLARRDFPGLGVLRSLVLLPLVLPPVVGGLALLYTFGRRGLLGSELDALGIQIAFSTIAVVMAQTFVAMPFLVVSLEGALRTAGQRYEVVAASLGAAPDHGVPPDHGAAGAARAGVGGGALVRAVAGRVRRHDHLRGQPPGPDPDPAAGDLPAARDRSGRRGRAGAGAGRGRRAGHRASPGRAGVRCELRAVAARSPSAASTSRFDVADGGDRWPCSAPTAPGKSTALAVTAGLVAPDAGRVVLDGRVLTDVGAGPPGRPRAAARPAYRAAGPGAAALPAPRRAGERRVRPAQRRYAARGGPAGRPALARRGRGGRAGRPPSGAALGWAGAAGRRGPGARGGAGAAAARRAAWRRSTSPCCPRCGRRCAGCWPTGPRSWSPTTRSTRCCSPTAWSCSRTAGSSSRGPSAEVLSRPRSPFAARLAGLNLVAGTWRDGCVETADGLRVHGLVEGEPPAVGRGGHRDVPARGGGRLPRRGRGQPAQRLRGHASPRSSRWRT